MGGIPQIRGPLLLGDSSSKKSSLSLFTGCDYLWWRVPLIARIIQYYTGMYIGFPQSVGEAQGFGCVRFGIQCLVWLSAVVGTVCDIQFSVMCGRESSA